MQHQACKLYLLVYCGFMSILYIYIRRSVCRNVLHCSTILLRSAQTQYMYVIGIRVILWTKIAQQIADQIKWSRDSIFPERLVVQYIVGLLAYML